MTTETSPGVKIEREIRGNAIKPGGQLPVQEIENILQTKGHVENGVLLVQINRTDINETGPNGHPFKPGFAPKILFFFQSLENGKAFMNAEYTFLENEMSQVLDAILRNGLEVMAEHQHYIGSKPQTFHYHFRGMDEPNKLARAAVEVVKASATPFPPKPASNPSTPLPKDQIGSILGGPTIVGEGGLVTAAVTRPETFVEDGVQLKPQTNVLHKIAIEPLDNNGNQALFGADFAMLGKDVNRTLKKARELGWQVHCLYNQQTEIYPQLFFSHTLKWGDPIALTNEVKQILDAANSTRHG